MSAHCRQGKIPVSHMPPQPVTKAEVREINSSEYRANKLKTENCKLGTESSQRNSPTTEASIPGEFMHKLMTRGTILEHELSELRLLVERHTGTLLDCPTSALANHVANYLESQQLESAAPLLESLRSPDLDPALIPQFLDGLLDTTTGFFRHPGAMNAFARLVLPQLGARKAAEGGQIRVWSAGCATGEEAYSIAMAVCNASSLSSAAGYNGASANGFREKETKEKPSTARTGGIAGALPTNAVGQSTTQAAGQSKDWPVQIVGSDLLPSSIQIAERGLYPQSALAGLPPASIRACFSRIGASSRAREESSGYTNLSRSNKNISQANLEAPMADSDSGSLPDSDITSPNVFRNISAPNVSTPNVSAPNISPATHLLVKARLRSMVTFNVMNLIRPVYIGRFDCIFCMDLLPSLSRAQRTALLERLHLYLEPGGYLFLSQTEKLSAPNLNFRSETFDGYTFHRKPLAASAAYGR
jgi:chemotaxis methyl-accepting protein methylase